MLGCSFQIIPKSSEIIPMEPEPVNPGVGSRLNSSFNYKNKRYIKGTNRYRNIPLVGATR